MTAKIVVIEDEAQIRELIVEELEEHGYQVVEACNGQEGLDRILSDRPSLIVSDITMPVMDGITLFTKIRKEHPDYDGVPFLFLSALADRRHIIDAKKMGADDYLTKPIDFELLVATIETRLGEITRISAAYERQMVKLYRALTMAAPAAEKTLPALLICAEWLELDDIRAAFQKLNIPLICQHFGSKLPEYLKETPPSVIVHSFATNDMSAKMVINKFGSLKGSATPSVLIVEDERLKIDNDLLAAFDLSFEMPFDSDAMARAVKKLIDSHAAQAEASGTRQSA